MKLVFATNNTHKLDEVRQILPPEVEVMGLRDIDYADEIPETGTTLAENSLIKANTIAEYITTRGKLKAKNIDGVIADDTGLEIDALDGRPGVYTARWYIQSSTPPALIAEKERLSEQEIYAANRTKALRELAGKKERGAQFKTVITLIPLSQNIKIKQEHIQVEGVVRGRIATEEYGEGGFGYDPIFTPEGHDKTFGELPKEIKNSISHRARAMAKLVVALQKSINS